MQQQVQYTQSYSYYLKFTWSTFQIVKLNLNIKLEQFYFDKTTFWLYDIILRHYSHNNIIDCIRHTDITVNILLIQIFYCIIFPADILLMEVIRKNSFFLVSELHFLICFFKTVKKFHKFELMQKNCFLLKVFTFYCETLIAKNYININKIIRVTIQTSLYDVGAHFFVYALIYFFCVNMFSQQIIYLLSASTVVFYGLYRGIPQ